jgi:hypothetical protein
MILDGNGYYHEIDVSYVFQEGAPIVRDPVELPKELIDRMREDLPKAYAGFGRKCVIKEYKADEFRRMAGSASVRNDLGVVVRLESGGYECSGISYNLDGIKYFMRYEEKKLDGVWIYEIKLHDPNSTLQKGAFGKELLDRMQVDLPKACAAFGRKCIFKKYEPLVKKAPRFVRNDEGKFQSEDGVVVYYTKANCPRKIVYEWEGGRWLVPMNKHGLTLVDMTWQEGAEGKPIGQAIRKQIYYDLNEAGSAGLFRCFKDMSELDHFLENLRQSDDK